MGIYDSIRGMFTGKKVLGAGDPYFNDPVILGNSKAAAATPTDEKLVREYLGTAYACGSINAQAVAQTPRIVTGKHPPD